MGNPVSLFSNNPSCKERPPASDCGADGGIEMPHLFCSFGFFKLVPRMSRHIPGDVFCPGILHLEYPLSTATFHRLVGTRNEMCLPSCFGVNGKGL